VKGSKIDFTVASSYEPPMVRMMTFPAALDRPVQMNGLAAAAMAVTARNFRREILPRAVRSIMVSPSTSRVSSGLLRLEPVLEALPVKHQRHDRPTPGVERDRRD